MVEPPMDTVVEIDRAQPSGTWVAPRESHGIRRILVCLDQSPLSEVCLPYAIFVSKTFGSSITLLHVMQPPQSGSHTTDGLVLRYGTE